MEPSKTGAVTPGPTNRTDRKSPDLRKRTDSSAEHTPIRKKNLSDRLVALFHTLTFGIFKKADKVKVKSDKAEAVTEQDTKTTSVLQLLSTKHSLTSNLCNTEALKLYIQQHTSMKPEEIAEQFMTEFFKPQGIDDFLRPKSVSEKIPHLNELPKPKFDMMINLLLPLMEEYSYDHLFEMLQVIEKKFSQQEMKQIAKLNITKQQLLMQKLFTENAQAAHDYLKEIK